MKKRKRRNAILVFITSVVILFGSLTAITVWLTDIEVVKLPQVWGMLTIFSIFVALIIAQPEKTKRGR